MSETYREWIAEHVPTVPTGLCNPMTHQMIEAFPELRRVRGHYRFGAKRWPHWWCVDARGEIVDPTAAQFAQGGEYEPHIEGSREPTGKCSNCGEYCYEGRSPCCSEACEAEMVAYLLTPRLRTP